MTEPNEKSDDRLDFIPDTWFCLVYVAAPVSFYSGKLADDAGRIENARVAVQAALELHKAGIASHVPLLTTTPEANALGYPKALPGTPEYESILRVDESIISHCDGVLRLPGESAGADREVRWAKRRQKPVWYSVADVVKYFRTDHGSANAYLASQLETAKRVGRVTRPQTPSADRVRPVGWRHRPEYKPTVSAPAPEDYTPVNVRDLGRRPRRTLHPSEMRRVER